MKEHELKEGIPYKTLYTLDGVQLKTMEDLKNFCLLEGFGKNDIGGIRRGPTMKLDASSRTISNASLSGDEDLKTVKRLNKASFVISPKNS